MGPKRLLTSFELADILCRELGKPRHSEAITEAKAFVPVFYRQVAGLPDGVVNRLRRPASSSSTIKTVP